VRKDGSSAQVTLIEGRIRVDQGDRDNPSATANLTAGEQLRVLPDRSFAISRAQIAEATSWRSGKLVFDRTPLRDVLGEFNRYTNARYVLRDEQLGDLLVNGSFSIRSSAHFAAALEAGFPVVVRATSNGNVFEVNAAQQVEQKAVR
ncbi:MAG: hypothetical protein HC826_01315, partial [Rhodospirillales bacterium]|nr:hypothetical protein [Rhodospirillales bacterium]